MSFFLPFRDVLKKKTILYNKNPFTSGKSGRKVNKPKTKKVGNRKKK